MNRNSLRDGNSNSFIAPAFDSLTEFADAMPVLVWIADADGKVVYYNAKVRDYTRFLISKSGNWAWKRLIHSRDLNSSLTSWNESLLLRKPYVTEHLLRMADGSYQWHVTRATPKINDNNNLICWYGSSTNIHAQKNENRSGLASQEMEKRVAERTMRVGEVVNPLENRNHEIALPTYNERFLTEFSQKFSSYDNRNEFFKSLVKLIYDMTKLHYVLVGKAGTDSDGKFIITTIALAARGELKDNIVYPMWNGPCYEVVKGKVYSYPRKCRQTFPENKVLVQFNVEGYIGYPLYDGNGNKVGLLAVMHEKEIQEHQTVTSILRIVAKSAEFELDRIEYENALEKRNSELQLSGSRLQSTFDGVPAMIALLDVVFDEDGRPVDFLISAANKTTADFLGCEPSTLIGKKVKGLYREEWGKLIDSYLEVFSTGKQSYLEFYSSDLKKWFSVFITKQLSGNGVVSFVIEITAQKEAEDERKRNLLLTELDDAKTKFFSNVSHELRTPLTLLLGPIEDILTKKSLPVLERGKLEMARRNALRLQKLVNSLLDFSRIEAGGFDTVFQPTNVTEFTTLLAGNFRSAIEKAGLKLIVTCQRVEPVYVNRNMWEKVVLNLLSNAFKFTFHGSIEIQIKSIRKHVQLHVRDTGIGISAEDLSRVFLRFVRIESAKARAYEGSGIGLALVKEMVSIHGGTIKVKSKVGAGSEFIVSIPKGKKHLPSHMVHEFYDNDYLSSVSESYREEAVSWLPIEERNSGKVAGDNVNPVVLLLDDNSDLRDYIREVLKYSFVVVEAANGRKAIELLDNGLAPDLIMADIMMPEMNGFEFFQAVKKNTLTSDIPFIFLSAKASEQERIEGIRAGADHYLIKPFSAKELLAIVKSKVKKSKMAISYRKFIDPDKLEES